MKSVTLLSLGFVAFTASAQPPTFEGKTLLFGNLHAHSRLSDDVHGAGADMLPMRAFEYADAHGIDFLAISDHQQATDARHRLFMDPAEYKTQLYDVALAYNAAHRGRFIAIPAVEWGNSATGNHVNLFGAAELPPDAIKNADYDKLYAWAAEHAEFAQFNHPYSWAGESKRNKAVGNFGEALYADASAFVRAADPVVQTVSVISTVAGGHLSGRFKASENKTHRDRNESGWQHYLRFLNLGFHISPAANQDTHGKNWGTVTAARTAVWADGFSYSGLMDGFKRNRVYATEDDELAVAFRAVYQNTSHWMGDTVPLAVGEEDVTLEVAAWQAVGSDSDAREEGPYTISIYIDPDGVGGQQATRLATIPGVPSQQILRHPLQVSPGQYVFIEVTEENGADNPEGDGDDESDHTSGADMPDGQRDNLNDSAWTSPVWFSQAAPTTPAFVWSKNSGLYHDATCWAVAQIGQANRQTGAMPPANKTKHTCKPASP